jgi:hypothetical protein
VVQRDHKQTDHFGQPWPPLLSIRLNPVKKGKLTLVQSPASTSSSLPYPPKKRYEPQDKEHISGQSSIVT